VYKRRHIPPEHLPLEFLDIFLILGVHKNLCVFSNIYFRRQTLYEKSYIIEQNGDISSIAEKTEKKFVKTGSCPVAHIRIGVVYYLHTT
jgi:hypothetical protein